MATHIVLVPDIFGSHLRDPDGRVWLDETALAAGIGRLAIDKPDVAPDGVMAAMYRTIFEAFEAADFEVDAFDYDWRQPARDVAGGLRAALQAAIADPAREVHIVAHGTGGFVAVEALTGDGLIEAFVGRGGRLVTLGTPFGGSHDIGRMLAGSHPLLRMLATLAGQQVETMLPVLAGWPGLREGQPNVVAEGAATTRVPKSLVPVLTTICGNGVPTPAAESTTGHGTHLYRAAGDGRVLVDDARVDGAATVVLNDTTHSDLIAARPALDACVDILKKTAVQITVPAMPARAPSRGREEPVPSTVTSVDLIEAASGALARRIAVVFPLTVSVAHGHLRQARFPLAVGHYRGDTIVSAEAALDAALGGRLSRRLELDMYPGPRGTLELVLVPDGHPPGGIIIGLGEVGDLTPQILTRLFSHAAVRYAVQVAEAPGGVPGWRSLGISTLLIGSDGGGAIGLTDSIRSLVRGVLDANRRLRATKMWEKVRIDRLEFIELFEETAVKAAHVVNALPKALEQELARSEEIVNKEQLEVQQGGEYLRPAEHAYGGGWWRRMQVKAVEGAAGDAAATGPAALELVYTPLTDRARLTQSTSLQSLEQVSRLVGAAMTQSGMDLKLSNALFELLIPPRLKESFSQEGNLVLMLNSRAARYPFELMAQRTRDTLAPLFTAYGLLRQLEGTDDTPTAEANTGREVLVIGPPDVRGWRPLTGARAEAERVTEIFRNHGYSPIPLLNATSQEVQTTVFASDPRILHIAAHGQYSDNPLQSGVVIGENEFFTTANVRAMRTVPELVFLNCCHIGQIGSSPSSDRARMPVEGYPALAASLAEGFMRAGVRAVVAAGWAVDDIAGLTFARTFYERFLHGDLFGEAVRFAREKTFRDHPTTNTWGAYQCYGSPEFRLRTPAPSTHKRTASQPVSRSELIAALRSLAGRAGGAQGAELTAIVEEFQQRTKQVAKGWRDGQTLAELAAVAAELEDFEQAIKLYDEALNVARALAPLRSVEQLANILGRHAPRLAVTKDSNAAAGALKLFADAQDWLNWLDTKLKPSAERRALLGSLHKRWAMLTQGRERRKHLKAAAASYQKAHEVSSDKSYQVLNWLALRYLLESRRKHPELAKAAREELDRAQKNLADATEPAFWDRVAIPDAMLHVALFEGNVSVPERATAIAAVYQNVLSTGPSARERASVRDHLQFLVEMLSDPDYKRQSASPESLQRFVDALT